jgi:hypothetical protein
MKNSTLCILGVLWILTSVHTQAQSILAGQASGANVIYHDIIDVAASSTYWWDEDYASLDLNDDGVTDLTMATNWIYYSHTNSQSVRAIGIPSGGFEYSSLTDNPTWIKKHSAGEEINNTLNFHADDGLFYSQYTSKGTDGNFSGEGYLVYRICNPDTLYGWIRIQCDVSYSGAYLTAYEYAYVINYTGQPHEMEIAFEKMIHKAGNYLMIKLPEHQFPQACHLFGFEVTGRQVFQVDLLPGSHSLNITGYPHGLYILRLVDVHGRPFSGKVIF